MYNAYDILVLEVPLTARVHVFQFRTQQSNLKHASGLNWKVILSASGGQLRDWISGCLTSLFQLCS